MNKNTNQKLWDTANAVGRGKFITLHANIRKDEMSQVNNLSSHLKNQEKEKQNKPETRRKEIMKIRAETNETEIEKKIEKINETAVSLKRSVKLKSMEKREIRHKLPLLEMKQGILL